MERRFFDPSRHLLYLKLVLQMCRTFKMFMMALIAYSLATLLFKKKGGRRIEKEKCNALCTRHLKKKKKAIFINYKMKSYH